MGCEGPNGAREGVDNNLTGTCFIPPEMVGGVNMDCTNALEELQGQLGDTCIRSNNEGEGVYPFATPYDAQDWEKNPILEDGPKIPGEDVPNGYEGFTNEDLTGQFWIYINEKGTDVIQPKEYFNHENLYLDIGNTYPGDTGFYIDLVEIVLEALYRQASGNGDFTRFFTEINETEGLGELYSIAFNEHNRRQTATREQQRADINYGQ